MATALVDGEKDYQEQRSGRIPATKVQSREGWSFQVLGIPWSALRVPCRSPGPGPDGSRCPWLGVPRARGGRLDIVPFAGLGLGVRGSGEA